MITTPELPFSSITALAGCYRRGETSPVDVTRLFLDRIDRLDPRLRAFITVAADHAMTDAREAERRLQRGDDRPLVGIPIAVKDSIATRGIRTTANSRVLEDWVPDRDAAAVERLREAGAVIIGKTNLNEFGWSIPREDDLCPPPRNPWNPVLAAVGSSSGSGVAVAAGLCSAALGTDGGGSVRLPAGQMGLVGVKPTHALVSRSGVLHAGSIGGVGVLARTVADAAILLNALASSDAEDSSGDLDAAPRAAADYVRALNGDLRGVRIGVPWSYIDAIPVEDEVRAAFDAAAAGLGRLGAVIVPVDLRALEHARAANFVVLVAEHYTAHETRLAAQWPRYGRSARLYTAMGAFVAASDYLRAREVGRLVGSDVDAALRETDALAMPTSPVVTAEAARRPDAHRRGINASFTAPFNLTGHPAFSVPCGISAVGLPMGFQIVGRRYEESTLFHIAHAFEQATTWHTLRPQDPATAGAHL